MTISDDWIKRMALIKLGLDNGYWKEPVKSFVQNMYDYALWRAVK